MVLTGGDLLRAFTRSCLISDRIKTRGHGFVDLQKGVMGAFGPLLLPRWSVVVDGRVAGRGLDSDGKWCITLALEALCHLGLLARNGKLLE